MPVPDTGDGNPPNLIRVNDGRLVLAYGYRAAPFRVETCISSDQGKTWTAPFVLKGNSVSHDAGYPRSIVRPDGKIVTVYPFTAHGQVDCHLLATIWELKPVKSAR